jgi:glutamate/tyrosine decarboxylase-like PLP-dependent enzyme
MIAGLEHVRALPTSAASDFALSASDLAAAADADAAAGLLPFFVGATVGTTSSCAVDPLPEIGAVCAE